MKAARQAKSPVKSGIADEETLAADA